MEERIKERKLMVKKWEWTRHLECGFLQDECRGPPLESSQITQDKT